MALTVDTSTTLNHLQGAGSRHIGRFANGNILVAFAATTTTLEFHYSDDDGATFQLLTAGGSLSIDLDYSSFYIDASDRVHLAYSDAAGGDDDYYRLGTPNAGRDGITWGTALQHNALGKEHADLFAFETDGDVIAVLLTCDVANSDSYECTFIDATVDPPVEITPLVVTQGVGTDISLAGDFRHTGDGRTVQTQPDWFVAYLESGDLMMRKYTYSAGPDWTEGAARVISGAAVYDVVCAFYDGTRFVMGACNVAQETDIDFWEHDLADTTTTSRGSTPVMPSAGEVDAWSATYDHQGNIWVVGINSVDHDAYYCKWTRATTTWDSAWTSIDAISASSASQRWAVSMKRGHQPGDAIEAVYSAETTSPYDIRYHKVAVTLVTHQVTASGASTTSRSATRATAIIPQRKVSASGASTTSRAATSAGPIIPQRMATASGTSTTSRAATHADAIRLLQATASGVSTTVRAETFANGIVPIRVVSASGASTTDREETRADAAVTKYISASGASVTAGQAEARVIQIASAVGASSTIRDATRATALLPVLVASAAGVSTTIRGATYALAIIPMRFVSASGGSFFVGSAFAEIPPVWTTGTPNLGQLQVARQGYMELIPVHGKLELMPTADMVIR